ncbi:MAG: hypothetical protein IKX37_00660 [Bacteroidales bacterium]|nr:hypothetical protein [Bacteroidales bacterium]
MKRILFLLTILVVTVTGASAQSLSGTWSARIMESESDQSDNVNTDMKMTGTDVITFSDNAFSRKMSCTVTLNAASQETSLDMTIKINGSASGTWKLEGSTLTLTPDKKAKPTLSVEASDCPALIQAMIVGPLKQQLKESLKEEDKMQITFLDDSRFSATDEGETVTYNKVK